MKIRESREIVASIKCTIYVKKVAPTYKGKYSVTKVETGSTPVRITVRNRSKAVQEIIRLLLLEGWKLNDIKKL